MKYKAICFDIDGTLYPARIMNRYLLRFFILHPFMNRTYSRLRAEYRKRQDSFALSELKDKSFSFREASVLTNSDAKYKTLNDVEAFRKKYYSLLLRRFKSIGYQKDTVSTFAFLKENNTKFAFLSDWPLGTKLKQIGLGEYADMAFSSDDTGYLKPSAHGFEFLLDKIGVEKKDVLYVGDSYSKDVLGAIGAGFDAVLVNVKGKKDDFPKALAVFETWADFDRWLRKMYE